MSSPFIGEICAFPYVRYVPNGWLLCDGSIYNLYQYQPLWTILGNRFGGDGKTTFGVPNLKGSIIVNQGRANQNRSSTTFAFGNSYGEAGVEVDWPYHTHQLLKHPPKTAGAAQKVATPSPMTELAQLSNSTATTNYNIFVDNGQENTILAPNTLQPLSGQGLPHENRQPFLCMCYAIAFDGQYPVPDN